jgi:cellulose synthase/poly-beta-1,6-N-acetylglucosamine synthase-like glycosyltransferase
MYFLLGLYVFFLAVILGYNFLQLNLLIHYLGRKKPVPPAPLTEPDLPFVTIQLPLYNEPYVAERLIDNIAAMDYPRDRFEVQILDDSTDATTELCHQKAHYYRERGLDIQVIHRTDRSGYKAGALAEGLRRAKGAFVAIFDADFLPNPRFLKNTIPYFQNERVGVVQTRWTHLNDDFSLFTKLQALQLNVHFTIEQMGRKAGHHFLQFNGTAGIWRKQTIEDAGGWKADTLTEDLDLSFRAQLRHWEIVYLEDVEAPAELPAEMNGIKSQQFRWMKGGAENARRLTPMVLKSDINLATKLHAVAHLANSSIFVAVFMIAVTSVALLPYLDNLNVDTSYLGLSLLGLLGVATVYFYANIHLLPRPLSIKQILALICYFPLLLTMSMGLSFHNSVAVIEGYLGIRSSFVRTPKYNIIGRNRKPAEGAQKNPISNTVIIEGLLTLLFCMALVISIQIKEYSFFVFHLMLALGFGSVFVVSWRDR